jgi:hypothetical protein
MFPPLAVFLITALMSRIATFETSVGTFKAELYCDQMPITWYAFFVSRAYTYRVGCRK